MSFSNPMHRDPRSVAPYVAFDALAYARRCTLLDGRTRVVVKMFDGEQDRVHVLPEGSERLEWVLKRGGKVMYECRATDDGCEVVEEGSRG